MDVSCQPGCVGQTLSSLASGVCVFRSKSAKNDLRRRIVVCVEASVFSKHAGFAFVEGSSLTTRAFAGLNCGLLRPSHGDRLKRVSKEWWSSKGMPPQKIALHCPEATYLSYLFF